MSSDSSKELVVGSFDSIKRVMFLVKEKLLKSETLNIIAGTSSAGTASGAAETLKRLGYITYNDIRSETVIEDNRRRTKFIICVTKTKDFAKLYEEHEKEIQKLTEERKNQSS